MSGYREVQYRRGEPAEYVADILTLGAAELFLPVSFTEDAESTEDGFTGVWRTEGYRRLAAVRSMDTEDILSTVILLLRGMRQSEKLYLFAEIFEIDADIVYVDKSFSAVKLVFMPRRTAQSPEEKIVMLLRQLREKGSEEGRGYIDNAVCFLRENQYGIQAAIHHLETLRKEVYLCSIA